MKEDLILILMIFLHIVDDYYLQGILATLKQKEWWRKNNPDKMYSADYTVALFMHSFSWSFVVMLPLFVQAYKINTSLYIVLFFINLFIHFVADDLNANKKKICLMDDQAIHIHTDSNNLGNLDDCLLKIIN